MPIKDTCVFKWGVALYLGITVSTAIALYFIKKKIRRFCLVVVFYHFMYLSLIPSLLNDEFWGKHAILITNSNKKMMPAVELI